MFVFKLPDIYAELTVNGPLNKTYVKHVWAARMNNMDNDLP